MSTTEASLRPKRIIRRRRRPDTTSPLVDPLVLQMVLHESHLPAAYSFEIPKTVQRIQELTAKQVALQMPEGLLLYATVLADVLLRLAPCLQQVSILGDVTYGACCVDDLGAQALGADLLVHYGHSCLVPLQHTVIPCLYVFVEIQIDTEHLVACLDATLGDQQKNIDLYLLGTVQFRHALVTAQQMLLEKGYTNVSIPQAKPLSPGEVLGCTSPQLASEKPIVCFVADGRFHLEATLISNPHCQAYRYDPYSKLLTEESYQHDEMKCIRKVAIEQAASAHVFGILMGTLGRQGNPAIVHNLQQKLKVHGKKSFLMLISEITPAKLRLLPKVDAWVQVACPRLSVDWGHLLSDKPVLNPYELNVCLEEAPWRDVYPMDFYANQGGTWTNYHEQNKSRQYECSSKECTC
jgi:2-(3-amino-3-carboxypropyl)histidine synthase